MDPVSALSLVLAHGGTTGLIIEISVGLAVLLVGGLAWQATRDENDEEDEGF